MPKVCESSDDLIELLNRSNCFLNLSFSSKDFLRGLLGPSTETLIAFEYFATIFGSVWTFIMMSNFVPKIYWINFTVKNFNK